MKKRIKKKLSKRYNCKTYTKYKIHTLIAEIGYNMFARGDFNTIVEGFRTDNKLTLKPISNFIFTKGDSPDVPCLSDEELTERWGKL